MKNSENKINSNNSKFLYSIITPVYNEEKNLHLLHDRLIKVFAEIGGKYEWIIIDDHSSDSSYEIIKNLATENSNVYSMRLSKNYGSHKAITAGLSIVKGDLAIVMASDLQDPPETIPEMINKWQTGTQIVWAVRNIRIGETTLTKALSLFYYWIMRKIVGMKDLPETGADYFLIDRTVIEALKLFKESNMNIFSLLNWMGFKQDNVLYDKQARLHGKSGWTFRKKIKLLIDSVTSFSHFPIRFMTYMGIGIASIGFLYACFVFNNALSGIPIPGWSSLIIVITLLGGLQLIMIGVLGEYLWRVLDESRRRPLFLIEEKNGWDINE